jgi:hypothetical protein
MTASRVMGHAQVTNKCAVIDRNFGCELCNLQNAVLRRFLELACDFRTNLLSTVTGCTPIFDEICRRALNFINDSYASDSTDVLFAIGHVIVSARSRSRLSSFIVFCSSLNNY